MPSLVALPEPPAAIMNGPFFALIGLLWPHPFNVPFKGFEPLCLIGDSIRSASPRQPISRPRLPVPPVGDIFKNPDTAQ